MEKNNKKELIIILIISILITLILILLYFLIIKPKILNNNNISDTTTINHENQKLFVYNDKGYTIPDGYEYLNNKNFFIIYSLNKNWHINVNLFKNNKYNNINEIYDNEIKMYNTENVKISLKNLLDNTFIIYKFLKEKIIVMCYIAPWDNNYYYRFTYYYNDDTFDLNELSPVIESLNNPITIKK